jgi:hypothetical protein
MARIRQPSINGAQTILQVDFPFSYVECIYADTSLTNVALNWRAEKNLEEHDEIDMGVAKEVDGEFGNKAGLRSK